MSDRRNFARDLVFSGMSAASSVFLLAFLVLVARTLGPAEFGLFSYAFAVSAIAGLLVDFGLPALLTRDIAKERAEAGRYFSGALRAQGVLFLVAEAAALAFVALAGFGIRGMAVTACLTLASAVRSVKSTARGVLRASNRFKVESISLFIERFVTFLVGVAALAFELSIVPIVLVYAAVRLADFSVLLAWMARRVCALPGCLPRGDSLRVARRALPLAAMNGIWVLYSYIDTIMLQGMQGATAVGIYGAAYRLFEGAAVLPVVVSMAVLPSVTEALARKDHRDAARLTLQGFRVLLCGAVVALAFGLVWSRDLVVWLYGAPFAAAANPLLVLFVALAFAFTAEMSNATMLALHLERRTPLVYLGSLVVNVGANMVLIPRFGPAGAAAATALSEAFCVALFLGLLWRPLRVVPGLRGTLSVVVLGGVTWVVSWLLRGAGLQVGAALGVTAVVSLAATLLVFRVHPEDRRLLQGLRESSRTDG